MATSWKFLQTRTFTPVVASLGVPVLGNLVRHQVLLQLSSKELSDKGLDVFCLNLVVVRLELGHVLTHLDGPEGGQLRLL